MRRAGQAGEREADGLRRRGLVGADVGRRVERLAPLVGGDATHGRACADGRAAGQEGHRLGRPAVVGQRGESRVGDVEQVMVGRGKASQAAGADQVERTSDVAGSLAADIIGATASGALVPRHNGVGQVHLGS